MAISGINSTPVGAMHGMQLDLMGLDRFDVYWVHNASEAPKWTRAVAEFFEGRDDAPVIGVSNHNLAEIKEADAILRGHGLKLGAVQNHFSLINRSSEESGILGWCRENGVVFFSYMALEQGALSGKYDTAHPMPEGSARAQAYNPVLDKLKVLNAKLAEVADAVRVEEGNLAYRYTTTQRTTLSAFCSSTAGATGPRDAGHDVEAVDVAALGDLVLPIIVGAVIGYSYAKSRDKKD